VSDFEYIFPDAVDFDTTAVTLRWTSEAGADTYNVYARDNLNNTSEVLIKTVTHRDHWVYHQVTLILPSQFDLFVSDGVQTPFAGGVGLTFNVAAANSMGEGPLLAPSKEIDVEDNVRPEIVSYSTRGSTDNSAGTAPIETVLEVQATEYIQNIAAQFNPANCFSCSILATNLNQTGDGMEATIAIGVGDKLNNDEVLIDFEDTSGNALITETYEY
jgi:hypothetical protein